MSAAPKNGTEKKAPRGVLKYHGGLYYQAPKIVALFPNRLRYDHFLDACVGGGSVFLAHDPEGKSEVINDLSGDLSNFWRVLRDPMKCDSLIRILVATPFSAWEWRASIDNLRLRPKGDWADWPRMIQVKRAADYFVMSRQSLAGRFGKDPAFAAVTQTRLRANMNEQVSAWLSSVEQLPKVHERMHRALVLKHDVIGLLKKWDTPRTLVYLDPPWMPETRDAVNVYEYEMGPAKHEEMLGILCAYDKAFVVISGRHCDLYDKRLGGWRIHEIIHKSSAGGGDEKRDMTHTVWCNYGET